MRDKEFWDKHYLNFSDYKASDFCNYCMENIIQTDDSIIELGCGNGKDGLQLINKASKYIGLDSSKSALSNFKSLIDGESEKIYNYIARTLQALIFQKKHLKID